MIRSLIHMFFPPLCLQCQEITSTRLFCPGCWEHLASLSFKAKCPHCFQDSMGLCMQCRIDPLLPCPQTYVFQRREEAFLLKSRYPDSLFAFFLYRWAEGPWDPPDLLVPLDGAKKIAQELSQSMGWKMVSSLREASYGERRKKILLIDLSSSLKDKEEAMRLLLQTEPQKMNLLGLIGDA